MGALTLADSIAGLGNYHGNDEHASSSIQCVVANPESDLSLRPAIVRPGHARWGASARESSAAACTHPFDRQGHLQQFVGAVFKENCQS